MTQAWDFVTDFILWQKRYTIMDKPLTDCEFSVRVDHCLQNVGLKTVGDLLERSVWELGRIPNMGARSIREIEIFLLDYGLNLRKGKRGDSLWPFE